MTSNNICVKLRNLIAHSAFRIVAALLFAAALQARATEYWVATDGADTNPGTSDAPFATLEYALSQKAQNGDTVKIKAGTYLVPQQADYTTAAYNLTNAVTVIGIEGPEKTIIASTNTYYHRGFLVNNANAVLSGLTVTKVRAGDGTHGPANRGKLTYCGEIHIEAGLVTNCVVHGTQSSLHPAGISASGGTVVDCVVSNMTYTSTIENMTGILVTGAATVKRCRIADYTANLTSTCCLYVKGQNAIVEDCVLNRCKTRRGTNAADYLVYITGKNAVVRNCEIVGCSADHVGVVGLTGAGAQLLNCVITNNTASTCAVYVGNATATMRNCLVAGNSSSGKNSRNNSTDSYGGIYLGSGTVENITVARNRNNKSGTTCGGITLAASTNVVLRNTISWGNMLSNGGTSAAANFKDAGAVEGAAAQGMVETCLYDQDPLFKDTATGDYTLASRSPARDAGTNQDWMNGATDLAGNRRKKGCVDIGCYEFQSASFCIIVR